MAVMIRSQSKSNVLTLAQIKRRYKDQWVLVTDAKFSPTAEVVSGHVVAAAKTSAEIHRKLAALRPSSSAVFYTGRIKGAFAL